MSEETVVKERPILFSAPMVRALLDGRKTQTRRVVKPQPAATMTREVYFPTQQEWCFTGPQRDSSGLELPIEEWVGGWPECGPNFSCPYGKPGDRLWVRETFHSYTTTVYSDKGTTVSEPRAVYRADGGTLLNGGKWKPSIFMPRKLSRITLEITEVRVQRLQDIGEEDAMAEGCEREFKADGSSYGAGLTTAAENYATLWESINGPGSWDANSWVWAITFKKLEAA